MSLVVGVVFILLEVLDNSVSVIVLDTVDVQSRQSSLVALDTLGSELNVLLLNVL